MNDLATLIAQIKKLSRNRRVVILLGGPIFTLKQYKASEFGAGAICTDAKDAVSMALSLIEQDWSTLAIQICDWSIAEVKKYREEQASKSNQLQLYD